MTPLSRLRDCPTDGPVERKTPDLLWVGVLLSDYFIGIRIFLTAGKSIELEGLKRDFFFFSRLVLRAYVLSLTVAGELALGDVRSPRPQQRTWLWADCLNDNPRQIRISAGH